MKLYEKHRLEIILERMAADRAGRVLEGAGVSGYTVLPALAGYGGSTKWRRDADISATRDMVVIVAIADRAEIDAALDQLQDLLADHIGVLNVSTVQVMRPDLF